MFQNSSELEQQTFSYLATRCDIALPLGVGYEDPGTEAGRRWNWAVWGLNLWRPQPAPGDRISAAAG